jgi:hypothetical protein
MKRRTIVNKSRSKIALASLFAIALAWTGAVPGEPPSSLKPPTPFEGDKINWHGFDRYDFVMDETDLSLKPFKPPAGENFAVGQPPVGHRRCVIVVPQEPAPGNPWSWRGCYWDHQPQTEIELLKRGFHIAFITPDPGKPWDAWYAYLTEMHRLSRKPAFIGMSKGGYNEFTWATDHPDKVACMYADNPAISRESLMKLDRLASNDVPLLHVCGSLDPLLGNHTCAIESLYQSLGGRISVMIKEGYAHHPHSLRDPSPIADFITQSVQATGSTPPAFAGGKFTKSAFYGVKNFYRDFPSEGTYITCRGPLFTECYDWYEFHLDGIQGAITVIVPNTTAAKTPWVFRAGFVDRHAEVDLALLARGFHIVSGPVPFNADGPVLKDWDAVYEHLTEHGFSRKPVMQGAGGSAGDAYAWAVENPDKVSCIYGENPVLRSKMSKTPPLDNLAPLAKAGVPILHVCGSLDPWLKDQTRVAEQRYKELGGHIAVIVKEGEGHYPLAPNDVGSVVEFITKSVSERP